MIGCSVHRQRHLRQGRQSLACGRNLLLLVIAAVYCHHRVVLVDASLSFGSSGHHPFKFFGVRGGGDRVSERNAPIPEETADQNLLERGKFLPDAANEQDLFDAYTEIQSDYERRAFHSNDWKVLNSKGNMTVSMLHHPEDPTCPYVKMRGIIPVPVKDCWDFLSIDRWDRNMPTMDPFYEGVTVHGEYHYLPSSSAVAADSSSGARTKSRTRSPLPPLEQTKTSSKPTGLRMTLCRKRMSRILAFGKRDLVFLSVSEEDPLPDGSLVSGTVSVRTNHIPRVPGYTRAFQDSIAFYKPIHNGTET